MEGQDTVVHEDKMWSALLSVLAHDLASPLTAIRWQTELLLERTSMRGTDERKTLEDVHASALIGIGVAQTVAHAVAVIRGEYVSEPQACVPDEVVQRSVALLLPQFERHRVGLEPTYGCIAVLSVDPALFELALWALLKRALAGARTDETVTLSVTTEPEGPSCTITAVGSGLSGADALPTSSHDAPAVFLHILRATARLVGAEVLERRGSLALRFPIPQAAP